MFLKNAWYVAAMPDEVADKPLGRTICGEKMVFYRKADGSLAAMEDFCPHRGAPLSLGTVDGDNLVCGYHGLAMGCEGHAVAMPNQHVRGFMTIKAYEVVERYGFIWVWPGERAQADPALIHHLDWAVNPEWAYGGGLFHINCDYRLMVDNLMDLTHETYVHSSSIGQREIDEAPVSTKVEGEHVITSRFMENIQAPPFWQMALRMNELDVAAALDRWQICHFYPPSHVLIEVGVAYAGQGGYHAPDAVKVILIVVDFITPETETSHWYFWGMARRFKPHDTALTAQIKEGQGRIFSEDREMLERQQQNIMKWPERRLMKLNIDAGGVLSRRVIDKLLADSAV